MLTELSNKDFTPHSYEGSLERILNETEKFKDLPRAFRENSSTEAPKVQSIQRLETLYHLDAEKVAQKYFNWLN